MDLIHMIQMQNGTESAASLKVQEEIQTNGRTCLLREYDIENYGCAVFAEYTKIQDGNFRRERSMMPFDNLDKTAKDFEWDIYGKDLRNEKRLVNAFVRKFDMFRKNGKGFYIYSGTKGSGKTLLSCCLANEIMNRFDICVKFVSILDYLDLTKKSYSSMADKEDIENIKKSGILIVDDIGVEVAKDWVNTTLYQLINYRYSCKLVTIITSNFPIEELSIGDRIKDRINKMCIPLHLPEVSVRSIIAKKENEEFVKAVL